jgi:hypothetical protein
MALKKLTVDIDAIVDQHAAAIQKTLLNLVEVLASQNLELQESNQKLKDAINQLKGEQGKPVIGKQTKGDGNHSSEDERNKRSDIKVRKKKIKKKEHVKIDRRVVCEIDKEGLPADAIFKGYETRVVQDIKIYTDNVEFSLPTYYSPSLKKTFIAKLPIGYNGEFGPGIRALLITLYRDSGMTEPALDRFFKTFNIQISKATISRMLTEGLDDFHKEKEDIIDAGLTVSAYQHLDDTGSRVNGKNHYTHILCNPYFTAYFTKPNKDRLTILEVLCRDELKFTFNQTANELMTELGLPNKSLIALQAKVPIGSVLTRQELDAILMQLFPNQKKHSKNRRIILESGAIVYYQGTGRAIKHLICDDAPQFNKISPYKMLCWIHEGRHYKKLDPVVCKHAKILDVFIEKFWDYYELLSAYRENPSVESSLRLTQEFDNLFSTVTGYAALDDRISKTLAKKTPLLSVLEFPFLPLHNNPAELGARVQARIRDINLQTITENGTRSKDTFATIVQTAKKLGVNIYNYIYDRISGKFHEPSLASLIMAKSNEVLCNTG